MTEPLLRIEDLRVYFKTDDDRPVRAIDSLSLRIDAGEVVGLVGESGCGKSVTALSIIRLLPDSADMTGVIHLEGTGNLLTLGNGEMTRVRGNALSIIFQEPMNSMQRFLSQVSSGNSRLIGNHYHPEPLLVKQPYCLGNGR